jgi:2'-5' RNA ligase superfamily
MEDSSRSRNNSQKINIHVPVEGDLLAYVRRINRPIVARGFSDISFQTGSQQIPHVTLLMGNIERGDLSQALGRIKDIAATVRQFEFAVTPPFIVSPSQKFCFLGVIPEEPFVKIKELLATNLRNIIKPDFHGGPSNPPHITFGYFNNPQQELPAESKEVYHLSAVAGYLEASPAGLRGTCSGILSKTKLIFAS